MDPVAETILACESDIILQRLTFDTVEDEISSVKNLSNVTDETEKDE